MLAFSPWGAATQTGTEHEVDTRPATHTLLHWTVALTFSLTLAYLYPLLQDWLWRRRASLEVGH